MVGKRRMQGQCLPGMERGKRKNHAGGSEQHSVEMKEPGRESGLQRFFAQKTDRFGGLFSGVADNLMSPEEFG